MLHSNLIIQYIFYLISLLVPYFLDSDHFQTSEYPPNLEEYLNVHFHFSRDKERFVISSRTLESDGILHVWNTGLLTDDGTDAYYAFHLEFDDFKPILSLISSKQACMYVSPNGTISDPIKQINQEQLYQIYLNDAINKKYDQDLYISQWPQITQDLERCSFFKDQKVESVVFCDYIPWDLDSIKILDLPKSLHPYKDDIVMNQLRISIEETRLHARINPRLAIPGLSRKDVKEDLTLQNINNPPTRSSWESSSVKVPSPLTRSGQDRKEKIPPVGLLLPLRIREIDAKGDCDAIMIFYDTEKRKYVIREILSLIEAQNRVRFIQSLSALEDTWLSTYSGASASVNIAQHEITRQRSQSQHSPTAQFSHHGQNINGLPSSASLHNLSRFGGNDGSDSQFPTIQVNTNHFSTQSVNSWEAVSVSTSPIISPRNSGPNIWSPNSPTDSPTSQINHHLTMYKQNNGKGNRPRAFSSPLLFPGTQTPFNPLTSGFSLSSQHQLSDILENGISSHISTLPQSDLESSSSLYNNISQSQSSLQPSLSSSIQSSLSLQQNFETNQNQNQNQSFSQSSQLSQVTFSQKSNNQDEKSTKKLTEIQLDAKKSASLIPDTDPIWKYKQWQLLEMYEKIKKDYPSSPDLGQESSREEIIYHMLRANFKWKCELCLRFNQQDPLKSLCKFKKAPWKCYFAHGSDDLRQKKKYF